MKKKPREPRNKKLFFRVTEKEHKKVIAAAKKNEVEVSEYLREKILGRDPNKIRARPVVPAINRKAYLALGRIKERTYSLSEPESVSELNQRLDEIMLLLLGLKNRESD